MSGKRLADQDRVIVFDLDDTLYMERDFARSGYRAVGDWTRAKLGLEGFGDHVWRLFLEKPRPNLFDLALEAADIEPKPELIRQMVEVYRDHRPKIALLPDAERILAKRANYRGFALLTDGYHSTQQRKIDALELAAICQPVVPTDQWGRDYWKPHARGFEAIQAHYGLPGHAFTYVGDNPVKDFIAPKALGWHTVRLRREGGLHALRDAPSPEAEALVSITSLDALAEVLT